MDVEKFVTPRLIIRSDYTTTADLGKFSVEDVKSWCWKGQQLSLRRKRLTTNRDFSEAVEDFK